MFNPFSKTDADEEVKETIALFRPQIEQLKAEIDATRVGKQEKLLPGLHSIMQQREGSIRVLKATVDQASDKEAKAIAAAKEATAARCRAASELSSRSSWFDYQEQLIRAQIYELAPVCIVERQRAWRDLADETRLKIDTEERRTSPNIFGGWNTIFVSNLAMVKRRVNVITEAIKAAEEMKLEPLAEAEAIQKLDAMEKQFPPLTNDRETTTIPGPDVSELRRTTW